MSEMYEVNENYETTEGTETTGGLNGKGLAALIGGGLLLVGGLAGAGINKLKNKKAAKADEPKTKLKLFARVPVETKEEIVEETEDVKEEPEKKDKKK